MARVPIGRVSQLWRYPVKSMAGEALDEAVIDHSGIVGDRKWALRDVIADELTNCKLIPSLLTCSAHYSETPEPGFAVSHAVITLPDGRTIGTGDPFVDSALSAIAGRPLVLRPLQPPSDTEHYRIRWPMTPQEMRKRMGLPRDAPIPDFSTYEPEMLQELQYFFTPRGSYKDAYPLHLVTSASLASIRGIDPDVDLDPRRFRPNIYIETDDSAGFPEEDWRGMDLLIGDAILHCGPKTVRCCMPGQRQRGGVVAEPRIGPILQEHKNLNFGAYFYVRKPGTIRAGDRIELETTPRQQPMRPDFAPLAPDTPAPEPQSPALAAGAFNPMHVVAKNPEADEVCSITLRTSHPARPTFIPGQHLLVRLHPPDHDKPVIRSYSISTAPGRLADGDYRITVKRQGMASSYLHDQIHAGDELEVRWPTGRYFLLPSSDAPIVFISNGIGVTPLFSMLESIAANNPERTVFWVHATKNSRTHIFKKALADIARRLPNLASFVVYRQPEDGDTAGQDYDSTRYLTADDLAPLAGMPGAEVFLCGTLAFMDRVKALVTAHGIDDSRIHIELFGAMNSSIPSAALSHWEADIRNVRFARSGIESQWIPGSQTLLDLAEELGVGVDYGCRYGTCQACSVGLVDGSVTYPGLDVDVATGEVLLCCAQPTTDLELDI